MTVSAGVLRAPVSSFSSSISLLFHLLFLRLFIFTDFLIADFRTGIPEPESFFLGELG